VAHPNTSKTVGRLSEELLGRSKEEDNRAKVTKLKDLNKPLNNYERPFNASFCYLKTFRACGTYVYSW
jgi:hypothetical protein